MNEFHGNALRMAILCACSLCTVVSATTLASSATEQSLSRAATGGATSPSRASMHSLRRVVDELRRLADKTRYLQEDAYRLALLENDDKNNEDDDITDGDAVEYVRTGSEAKRTGGAWDMDYGWGGGRFGKRRDRLSLAGRFGRSIREGADEEK